VPEPRLEDLLDRLERERLEADRLYNDALTALDRAIQVAPILPGRPKGFDASRLPDLNHAWNILPAGPPLLDRSIKGRLRGFVWRLIGPPLETQKQFNAAVADHLNRNAAAEEEWPQILASLVDGVRREFDALVRFESLLIQYLQTITLYVDSKDRSFGGAELRQRFALAEQRILALKRDLDASAASAAATPSSPSVVRAEPFGASVDSLTYVEFERRFRGSMTDVRARVEEYLPLFATATDVVDVGCGRGELLELLKERGVDARGVDVNAGMVQSCRSRGLRVDQGDALTYLSRQGDAAIGGLVAIQVVEHFEPLYLARFLETAFHKMRPGAPIVLETVNPACWMAFFETYIRDLTHQRPLHPDTLRYMVEASGFSRVDVQYRRPVRDTDRLRRLPLPAAAVSDLVTIADAINDHADKLNARLFSSMDYVVIARR
jgi:O-antigen chain-terminating methyltransferase